MQYAVEINHIETASLYFGCRTDPQTLDREEKMHEMCTHLSGDNRPCDATVGKIVGVFLPIRRRWVRGRIMEIIPGGSNGTQPEYKLFLIDKGFYLTVKNKQHLIALNDVGSLYDSQFQVMALDEVLPTSASFEEAKNFLSDLLTEGRTIFMPKTSGDEAAFGDIFIKPFQNDPQKPTYDQKRIDVKAELLKKGFVMESESYMEDVSKLLAPKKELSTCLTLEKSPRIAKIENEIGNENRRAAERKKYCSRESHNKDTGYSSLEESNTATNDNTTFFPAGYQCNNKQSRGRKSRSEEFVPRNPYVTKYREAQRALRTEEQANQEVSSQSGKAETDDWGPSPPPSKPVKRVSWGGTTCQPDSTRTDVQLNDTAMSTLSADHSGNLSTNTSLNTSICNSTGSPSMNTSTCSSVSDTSSNMSRTKRLKQEGLMMASHNLNSSSINTSFNSSTTSNSLNISTLSSVTDASPSSLHPKQEGPNINSSSFNTSLNSSTTSNSMNISTYSSASDTNSSMSRIKQKKQIGLMKASQNLNTSTNTVGMSSPSENRNQLAEENMKQNSSKAGSPSATSPLILRLKELEQKALARQSLDSDTSNSTVEIPPTSNCDLTSEEELNYDVPQKHEREKAIVDLFEATEEDLGCAAPQKSSRIGSYSTIQNINKAAGVLIHTKNDRAVCPITSLSDSRLHSKIIEGRH